MRELDSGQASIPEVLKQLLQVIHLGPVSGPPVTSSQTTSAKLPASHCSVAAKPTTSPTIGLKLRSKGFGVYSSVSMFIKELQTGKGILTTGN